MKRFLLTAVVVAAMGVVTAQVPADSVGVFAVMDGQYVRMERITHNAIKGSGGLGAAFSFGIAKVKAKMQFKGATSPHQFQGKACFRMYFGQPPTQNITNLYMFGTNHSIKDFDIARFDVKKNVRLLTGSSASILGSSVGVSATDDLEITVNEVRPQVYDIIAEGKPGEYCIIYTGDGAGGFGGVFDFTICK